MKKFLAILLAAMLVLSMTVVAFADGDTSEAVEFKFAKSYTLTGGTAIPAETLKFSVAKDADNPDDTMITVVDQTIGSNPQDIVVTIPQTYTKVGKYNYTVTETAGNTQGVTYATNSFGVQVLVTNDADNDGLLDVDVTFTTKTGEGTFKVDGIVNEYKMGNLKVAKQIEGNLASADQAFSIDVTFTAESGKVVKSDISYGGDKVITVAAMADGTETVTIELKAGQDCTFSNIPDGVTYTVVEQSKHTVADPNGSDPSKGYTVTYTESDATKTISVNDNDEVTVTNKKGGNIDTGITTDSLPYVLLMGIVLLAGAAMIIKRRAHNN